MEVQLVEWNHMSEQKRINDKRLPFWLRPVRKIYRALTRGLSRKVVLKQTSLYGCEVLVWANEDIGKKVLLTKAFERDEIHYLKQQIRQGDICLDVGGNTGIYAMLFAQQTGETGAVYVFEPIRRNTLAILLAAEINEFGGVRVFEGVAGSENGQVKIVIPESDGAYAHIKKHANEMEGMLVRSVTLDTFIENSQLNRIDILKIDVEGAEFEVLQGARGLLACVERSPRIVMIELCTQFLADFDTSIDAVISYMGNFGYAPHYVDSRGKLHPYKTADMDKVFNVFFVRS